jgi:adenylate cyclase
MGIEIERKFLLKDDAWRSLAKGKMYRQGYLSRAKGRIVRIRTVEDRGFITVKGSPVGITRFEYEYEIPVSDAIAMLDDLCEQPTIIKKRHAIDHAGRV